MRATIKYCARGWRFEDDCFVRLQQPFKISRIRLPGLWISRELGYVPDPVADVAMKQTSSIGLLLPQSIHEVFQNPYISEIMRGIGYICDRETVTGVLSLRES